MNKKTVESLAKSGALDCFGKRRAILEGFPLIQERISRLKNEEANGQESLFVSFAAATMTNNLRDEWPDVPEFLPEEKLRLERELLGLYVSDHPLKHIGFDLEKEADTYTTDVAEKGEGKEVKMVGMLSQVRKILTKTEKHMGVGQLEDLRGTIPIVCFPRDYERNQDYMVNDMIVAIKGKISNNRDEWQIVVNSIEPLVINKGKQSFYIDLEAVEDAATLQELRDTLKLFRGSMPVVLHTVGTDIGLDQEYWIHPEPELRQKIDALIGSGRSWLS